MQKHARALKDKAWLILVDMCLGSVHKYSGGEGGLGKSGGIKIFLGSKKGGIKEK